MATIDVKDAAGSTVAVEKPLAPGRAAAAASRPVTLSDEDFAVIDGLETAIASTNTKLDTANTNLGTIDGHIDGLETAVASTNTKLDTVNTNLSTIDGRVDGIETLIGTTNSTLGGTLTTAGSIAHDSADSGNPVKIGAKAIAALSGATLVSAGDRADAYADLDGAILVRSSAALGDLVNGNASNTDGSPTQVIAAGATGVKHYITDVTITNTSASNIYVELKDGTTVKWTFPVPANGGVTHHFASPIGGSAATAWNFDPSAAATTIYCSAAGFKSKI